MARKQFHELPLETLSGKTIVLDVDGTLLRDGATVLTPEAKNALISLSRIATVYLCSNAETPERLHTLAEGTNAHVLVSPYKKPDPRILRDVAYLPADTVVIGDKHLTDELLAILIRAQFIHVARIQTGNERLFVRLAYVLDALFGKIVCSGMRYLI